MTKLNILGSTGIIGKKALNIINKDFNNYSINFLMANNNYKLLSKQANQFKPKYIGLLNEKNYIKLKNNLDNKNIKIVTGRECYQILNKSVDSTLVSISGISALKSIISSIKNSKKIGIVNKESIVSAGKFIIPLAKKSKTKIIPLDSEHFSIYNFLLNYNKDVSYIDKIYLTASGGPFLYTDIKKFKNIKPADALKHPTWKMGIKNTIDSSTMMNKCLEIVEAHYLFNLDYKKLDIIIHPESLIHSIIKVFDGSLLANISNNTMSIPIYDFLNLNKQTKNLYNNLDLDLINKLTFIKPDKKRYDSLKIFEKIDKNSLSEIIVFNTSNEIAVELFIKNKISFPNITKFIENSLNKFEKTKICNISDVIHYQSYVFEKLGGFK
tara:strand:- start:3357 stop:4502 length:1146 start_codon:yes stop_codon:yes gene_type:complete